MTQHAQQINSYVRLLHSNFQKINKWKFIHTHSVTNHSSHEVIPLVCDDTKSSGDRVHWRGHDAGAQICFYKVHS